MGIRLVAPPALEPVPLAEIKAHLGIDGAEQDPVLTTLTVVARAALERLTKRQMITQTWTVTIDAVPPTGVFALPLTPVQTVTAVRVAAADGSLAAFPLSGVVADLTSEPARLLFTDRPRPGRAIGGIEIDVVAGYGGTPAAVPAPLVHAVKLLAAHWYESRGAALSAAMPADVAALVSDYRVRRLVA